MARFLELIVIFLTVSCVVSGAKTKSSSASSSNTAGTPSSRARRERSLDHWDAETLAFYLKVDPITGKRLEDQEDEYVGHDAAVMFYAQWDQHSHALAPTWDAIATHLKASTVQSHLIMALFDCELNAQHMQLCTAANVLHYPTLLFIGAGTFRDTDVLSRMILGQRSAGPAGIAPLPHTTKFQGNWQYGDAMLDWVRLMQGLSRWHRWTSQHGILRVLRRGLLGLLRPSSVVQRKKKPQTLPVGIPGTSTSSSGSSSSSSSGVLQAQVSLLQQELETSQKETKQVNQAASMSSLLLDGLLVPNNETNEAEIFHQLSQNNGTGWSATETENVTLYTTRTCLMELTLDYCSRISTHVTMDYVNSLNLDEVEPTSLNISEIETTLAQQINDTEPYCAILEACILDDFANQECRPASCPFQQEQACRYVNGCLNKDLLTEYAVALGVVEEGDPFPPPEAAAAAASPPKKKGKWGF